MAKKKKINSALLNSVSKSISARERVKNKAIEKAKQKELQKRKEEEKKRKLKEKQEQEAKKQERERELKESIESSVLSQVKVKITSISPLHIGSGEVYEPTNFIIDENILYFFKDEDLLNTLNAFEIEKFIKISTSKSSASFARLNKYIKENLKDKVKKIAFIEVPTTVGINKDYEEKVGEIVQVEAKNKHVFNKFEIQRSQRVQIKDKNYKLSSYIPGSSLKGAISTAYREYLYKNEIDGEQKVEQLFENVRNMRNLLFKYFKIIDSKVISVTEEIGYSCNRERFEEDNTGPYTIVETIQPNSQFEVTISYDREKINFLNIVKACNDHYRPIFESMYSDGDVGRFFSDSFKQYRNLSLKENQFLVRVGKYSGARAVTIDGLRDISIRESKGSIKKHQKEETTTWLYGNSSDSVDNLLPFGWVLCELC